LRASSTAPLLLHLLVLNMPPTPSESVVLEPRIPRLEYEAGTVIAQHYRLEVPIGFGAMGTVWRAHNELLDAPLALKLLRSNPPRAELAERLLLEAKAAACLRHPAIVRVFDFGITEHGDPFLAMELLQGESLRELLEREHMLPAPQAVRMLLPILAGLSCAHARGIVHRDLKPDNIFLARDDAGCLEPKVVDFGIAKFEGSLSHLTAVGVLLGSPSYMSPEQSRGEEEDLRVDVWAITVVLYEAISGKLPWEAPNCPALLRAIVEDPPSSLVGIGGVDVDLWAIIERGFSKRREDRWSSSRDLGCALAAWLDSMGVVEDVSGTSLKTAWLAEQEPDPVRGSLESIPPLSAVPTVEQPEHAARRTQAEDSGRSPRVGSKGRRITLGIAACVMLSQMGFRPSRAPTEPALAAAIAQTDSFALQSTTGLEPSRALPTPTTVPGTVAAAGARTSERPSRASPAPSASTSARVPNPKARLAPPGSARAMDFGF